MRYSSREKCLRLVADRSLDKSYSSRSKALFHSNGDAGLISDESPRLIDRYETAAPDAYAQLHEGVTFEVLPNEPGHVRLPSTDQEIQERCEFLAQVTGSPVTLVTGDSGVRINARARGIEVVKLGEEDLLPRLRTPPEPETAQSGE